jgi:hypothetical protein
VIRPRCPDPELVARLIERRLGPSARRRILDHAADCVACRRQLAVASLPEIGPLRATLAEALNSERVAVIAALVLLPMVLCFLRSSSPDPEPVRRTAVSRPRAPAPPPPARPTAAPGETVLAAAPEAAPATAPERAETTSDADGGLVVRRFSSADHPRPEPPAARPSLRETAVTEPSPAPALAEEPRPAEPEDLLRQAILDPFGSLALEGAGGRVPIQTSSVVPVEGKLTAVNRPSGFRLGDGTRLQLAAGSAVSVYHHAVRRCSGVTLHQGALLVDAAAAQPLFLRRDKAAGLLDGFTGLIHLSAGAKPDAIAMVAIGSGGVWRRQGQPPVEIAAGDQLTVEGEGQDLSRRGGKSKPSLARFGAWPEPTTLFFASFESDVQAGERPLVVQGTVREGFVSAVVTSQRRRVIELSVPPAVMASEGVVRLRFRTTAARIQCNASRSIQPVPLRSRSETAWTTLTIPLGGGDTDGHLGGGRGKRDRRTTLTITVEPPPKVAVEDLVFDIDEIEILRS